MEIIAYIVLIFALLIWLGMILFNIITSIPAGIIGMTVFLVFGLLFIRVLKDRINNKEDDYYNKTVFK